MNTTTSADLQQTVIEVANRWPSAGLAVAVVRDGTLDAFIGHGVADVDSKTPITVDTVFRIGSITKTFTPSPSCSCGSRG